MRCSIAKAPGNYVRINFIVNFFSAKDENFYYFQISLDVDFFSGKMDCTKLSAGRFLQSRSNRFCYPLGYGFNHRVIFTFNHDSH